MSCYCNVGWVCAAHRDKPMGHDACFDAGAPCENSTCGHGRQHLAWKNEAIARQLEEETEKQRPD